MKIPTRFLLLIFIVLVAALLRFWQFGLVPPSPDWDEAALGYNAYSIMHTARDEYGEFLPIILRSFDDYKPALYVYLIIPFIKLFDLNIIAVRLPSAAFGIFTVLATYFLVKEIFRINNKSKITNPKQIQPFDFAQGKNSNDQNSKLNIKDFGSVIPLMSAGLLAISPWHIQFSRIAFESNVAMGLNICSVFLFLKSLKRPWILLLTAFVMGISLYMYQSEKVFVPLLFIILVFVFRKELLKISKKYLIASVAVIFLIAIPMIHLTLTNKDALARAKGVSIFSDLTPFLKENVQKLIEDKKNKDYLGLLLDNRRVEFAKSIISGYISHFDLNWLFITGDIARHHAPNMALLYLWELPFLLIGIYSLIFGNFDKRIKMLVFLWFLAAPIPASITSGVPHAVRTLNFLPIFQIFTAIGLFAVFSQLLSKYHLRGVASQHLGGGEATTSTPPRWIMSGIISSFFIFNFLYYLNQYFVQQNYFNSVDWQYGYKQAIDEVKKIESKYSKIIVSNQPHLDQSYMFFLFYLKYSPSLYQEEAKYASGGFRENHKFGKFEFRSIVWDNEIKSSDILYVGRPSDFMADVKKIKTIDFVNGKQTIVIVEG